MTSYSYLHMVLYVMCAEVRLNRSFKMATNLRTNLVQKDTDRQYNGLTERIIGLEYDRLSLRVKQGSKIRVLLLA